MERVDSIKVSIRPNHITKQKLKMLKKYKVKTIELEVYSTNEYILKKIGMEYSFNDIKKASRMIRFYRFKLGHKITIGLPDSTKIDDINTAKNLIKLKIPCKKLAVLGRPSPSGSPFSFPPSSSGSPNKAQ